MWSSTVVTIFLVSLKITGSAPPPLLHFTVANKAYTIYFNSLNWFEAMEHCRHKNKILGSIPNMAVNQMMLKSLKPYYNDSFTFWLGAYDIDHEGEFVWLSTGRRVDNFTNWRSEEPDNWYGAEHCVEMLSDGEWNDAFCTLKKYVFCENLPS